MVYAITDTQARNGVRNLMVDYLGAPWAKEHILIRGSLTAFKRPDLLKLYARAQVDAEAFLARMEKGAPRPAFRAEPAPLPEPALTPRRTPLPDWPRGMNVKQAAAYVGLSVSGVHRLRRKGDFARPLSIGDRLVFLRDHLDAWLNKKAGVKPARKLTGDPLLDWPDASDDILADLPEG